MAQLDLDATLASKIIILDDPFCSLDRSRRDCTKQLIFRLSQKAEQVIVLSHDPHFLKAIWEISPKTTIKELQFFRLAQNTTISEWNIERETSREYFKLHAILNDFVEDGSGSGDKRTVATSIRPLLEEYLRMKLPRQFAPNEWLGDFIGKIRNAQTDTALERAKEILNELEDINDYSKKYHHNQNANAHNEPISDGELQRYTRRTLDIVGGF